MDSNRFILLLLAAVAVTGMYTTGMLAPLFSDTGGDGTTGFVAAAPAIVTVHANRIVGGAAIALPLNAQPANTQSTAVLLGQPPVCESGFSRPANPRGGAEATYRCEFSGAQRANTPKRIGRSLIVDFSQGAQQNVREIAVDLKQYRDPSFTGTESARINFYYYSAGSWQFGEFCMVRADTTCRKSFARYPSVSKILVAGSGSSGDSMNTIVPYVSDVRIKK